MNYCKDCKYCRDFWTGTPSCSNVHMHIDFGVDPITGEHYWGGMCSTIRNDNGRYLPCVGFEQEANNRWWKFWKWFGK